VTRLIYVCSPWRAADEVTRRHNRDRALRICRDLAMAGDVPVASHLLYPQFLNDDDHVERGVGLRCALALLARCDEVRVFGTVVSEGMAREIAAANALRLPVRSAP
jgi:hypothetical protein